jgi:hypothetical protein
MVFGILSGMYLGKAGEGEGENLRSGQNRLSAVIRDSLKACIKTASAAGIGKYAQKTF